MSLVSPGKAGLPTEEVYWLYKDDGAGKSAADHDGRKERVVEGWPAGRDYAYCRI